jgi:hypothetical protein
VRALVCILLLAMGCAACLHEPVAGAPATPETIAQCQTDSRIHTVEVIAGAVLATSSLGTEWGALEASNTSTARVPLADTGAILGAVGLVAGVLSAVTLQTYEDDGCSDLTPAAMRRQHAQDLRTLDLMMPEAERP